MNELIVCIFLCVQSGCMVENRAKQDSFPAKPLDTQTCINDFNAPNSTCAHSVDPPLN